MTLFDLLARLYRERFSGRVVLHFGGGVPHFADVGDSPRERLERPTKAA